MGLDGGHPNHMTPDDSDGSSAMDYWGNEGDVTQSHGRYQLAYIDLYDPVRHGFDSDISDDGIHGQFLCNMSIDVEQWRQNPAPVHSVYGAGAASARKMCV